MQSAIELNDSISTIFTGKVTEKSVWPGNKIRIKIENENSWIHCFENDLKEIDVQEIALALNSAADLLTLANSGHNTVIELRQLSQKLGAQ